MGEKCLKITLMTFNIMCLMGGIAMLAGGLLITYNPQTSASLATLAGVETTPTQLGSVAYVMVALGGFIVLVSFIGCCGAMSESKCMIGIYLLLILLLFIGQLVIGSLAIYYGKAGVSAQLNTAMTGLANKYHDNAKTLDLVHETFECCGPNGTNIYYGKMPATTSPPTTTTIHPTTAVAAATLSTTVRATTVYVPPATTVPSTTSNSTTSNMTAATAVTVPMPISTSPPAPAGASWWPDSCCRRTVSNYTNLAKCHNYNQMNATILNQYVYTQGCIGSLSAFIDKNLITIGGCALGLALLELLAIIISCKLYRSLD